MVRKAKGSRTSRKNNLSGGKSSEDQKFDFKYNE